jgi:hypothetical protein
LLDLVTDLEVEQNPRAAALEAHERTFSRPIMATQKILRAATAAILGWKPSSRGLELKSVDIETSPCPHSLLLVGTEILDMFVSVTTYNNCLIRVKVSACDLRRRLMNITFVQVEDLLAALIAAVGDGLRSVGVHATNAVDSRAACDVDSAQIGGDTAVLELIAVPAADHVDGSTREVELSVRWQIAGKKRSKSWAAGLCWFEMGIEYLLIDLWTGSTSSAWSNFGFL